MYEKRKPLAAGDSAHPVTLAKQDVMRMRAVALHIEDIHFQGDVYRVCQSLARLLHTAERNPGTLATVGPVLCITKRLRESLELYARLVQRPLDAHGVHEVERVGTLFRDLGSQYAELEEQMHREDLSALKRRIAAITGVLDPTGRLPDSRESPGRAGTAEPGEQSQC